MRMQIIFKKKDFVIENGVLKKYLGKAEHVVIPDGVKVIDEFAFWENTALKTVSIPDSVTEIRKAAFGNCRNLLRLTIPAGVTGIAESLCVGCYMLDHITFPSGLKTIGSLAFGSCGLTEVILPEGLEEIKDNAFLHCEHLEGISIPDSLRIIGEDAFRGCKKLKPLNEPNCIVEIGKEAFGRAPVGTGPYKVVEFSPERVVMERYEGYYGEAPVADRIEYVLYSEISARISALIAGDCDIILQVTEDMKSVIDSYADLQFGSVQAMTYYLLRFNTQNGPMASKELRHAMCLAIDRQALCDAFFMGNATVPNGYNFPEYGDYYVPDYPYYEYNHEKAKELVAASGYDGTEITFKLRSGYYTYGDETAEAIVAMWKEAGINAHVEFINAGDKWENVTNWSNGIRFTDPAGGLWLLWGASSGMNDPEKGQWKDMPQEYIDAGRAFESSTNYEERYALNRKIMEMWDEECPGTVLFRIPESWANNKKVHFERGANRLVSLRAEHFWFEDAE